MTQYDHEQRPPDPPFSADEPLGTSGDADLLAYQRRNTRILWGILGILLLMAAAVFLVLPDYVSPPDLSAGRDQVDARNATPPPPPQPEAGAAISPFEEAQRMRQREAAQETLGELLELQEQLEERGVEQWAGETYEAALAVAESGDSAYREQDFITAGEHYRDSLATLEALEADMPAVLEELLASGEQAIRDGQSGEAQDAFELAMTVAPDSIEADEGLQRAQVLDQVLALNEQAAGLREAGDLEAARDLYREALSLDELHQQSRDALESVEAAIEERNFTRLMSQGYGELARQEPEAAEDFFQRALRVRPGSSEATSALEQVRDQMTSNTISRLLEEAAEQEAAEQWQQALETYEQALEVDPNVVAAEEGLERSRSRRNLDNYLSDLLEDPLSLADEATYRESRELYLNALRIPDAGPRLREQLDRTKFYLEQVRIPRDVQIISDGMTRVTLLRHEILGEFQQRTLSLTPGRYVATGTRTGYRDVREEFVVPFEDPAPQITVICDESIR